jgi:hypothetical protein
MELLLLAMVLGVVPAMIASKKGGNGFLWWIYGTALFVIALVHALLMEDRTRRSCPFCAERIKQEAKVCPHCQRDLMSAKPEVALTAPPMKFVPATEDSGSAIWWFCFLGIFVLVGIGVIYAKMKDASPGSATTSKPAIAEGSLAVLESDRVCIDVIERAVQRDVISSDVRRATVRLTGEGGQQACHTAGAGEHALAIRFRRVCAKAGRDCVRIEEVRNLGTGNVIFTAAR